MRPLPLPKLVRRSNVPPKSSAKNSARRRNRRSRRHTKPDPKTPKEIVVFCRHWLGQTVVIAGTKYHLFTTTIIHQDRYRGEEREYRTISNVLLLLVFLGSVACSGLSLYLYNTYLCGWPVKITTKVFYYSYLGKIHQPRRKEDKLVGARAHPLLSKMLVRA